MGVAERITWGCHVSLGTAGRTSGCRAPGCIRTPDQTHGVDDVAGHEDGDGQTGPRCGAPYGRPRAGCEVRRPPASTRSSSDCTPWSNRRPGAPHAPPPTPVRLRAPRARRLQRARAAQGCGWACIPPYSECPRLRRAFWVSSATRASCPPVAASSSASCGEGPASLRDASGTEMMYSRAAAGSDRHPRGGRPGGGPDAGSPPTSV